MVDFMLCVYDSFFLKKLTLVKSSLLAQGVKDPALLLLSLWLQLWHGFSPWPGNFHMLQGGPKRKKERKKLTLGEMFAVFL